MFDSGNVYTLLKTAKIFLESKGLAEPKPDAEVLLSSVLQIKRSKLPLMRNQKLTNKQMLRYKEYILRRSQREPVAYITGFSGFMDFEFKVNKNVLIPRAETEILVEAVLKLAEKKNKSSVLDLCTGSGCIAVSLAKLGKFENVTASDISKRALEIAQENAQFNNTPAIIDFIESNIFDKITKNFDIIASNPPYISDTEYNVLEPELKYEPKTALMARGDGLFFYKEIARKAHKYLKDKGFVLLELNANKADKIKQIFSDNNYKNIAITKDYAGLSRVLKACVAF